MKHILQLYTADARGVVQSRVGPLSDLRSALVRREINGEYTLTASLPRGGLFEDAVQIGSAIKATVNEAGLEQYFIVKSRSRSLTGDMTIHAEHQSYLYNGIMVNAGNASPNGRPSITFPALRSYAVPSITDIATWTYSRSATLRANFPERPGPISLTSALKDYLVGNAGGELIFDGFDVEYVDQMGSDNGAAYRYGTNMTEMDTEDIIDGYASGIYPYWGRIGDGSRPITTITGKIYSFTGTFPMTVIVPVDFTDKFDTQPSEADLLGACAEYEALYAPTTFPLSIRASRVRLTGDVPIDLGDTVRIVNSPWGIDQKTRVMALDYDALLGRVTDVELGTINPGFAGAVKNMK